MIWMGKVASVALLSLGLSIVPANAQSNDMQARVYYYSAEEAYSGGHFQDALKALEKAENLLGKGNARTAALRVKILMGTADYVAAIEAMKVFFSYNPADSLMREIAPLQLEIDQKLKSRKSAKRLPFERKRL